MPSLAGVIAFIVIFALSGAQKESSLIQRTHKGLEKGLNFVLDDYQQINFDGLYGIVLAHGFLENILQMNLSEKDIIIVAGYKKKIEKIVVLVKPLLFGNDPTNNILVENIINLKSWYRGITFQENAIDPNFYPNNEFTSVEDFLKFEALTNFNGRLSNKCFLDIVSSGSNELPHNCTLSKWCTQNMINNAKMEPAYLITHRLLLLQIARSQNCIYSKKQFHNKIRSYCSYIYWEMRQNQKLGFIRTLDDLLLEQVTLCGSEGFGEFVRKDLIEYVFSIQTEHGCFAVNLMTRKPTRSKRSANYIKYGCNDHSTGLGISSMSLFLLSLYKSGETLY